MMPGRGELAAKTLLWLAFAALKVASVWGKAPLYTGDKRIWADIAQIPLFSHDFLFPRRPMALPLLYKVAGGSDVHIVRLQLGLSIFAWGILAHALARLATGIPSILIFVATLLTPLASPVHCWDLVIRAESTSHSFLVLTVAAAVHFLVELPTRRRAAYAWASLCAIFGFWCANARDSNAYVLLLFAGVVFVAGIISLRIAQPSPPARRASLWSAAGIAASLVLFSAQANWTAKVAKRYDFPLMNVIFRRVLPNAAKRHYFVDELKMPLSRALMTRSRKWASANRRYAFVAPELQGFRDWLVSDGYTGYQRYLLTHVQLTAEEAYAQFPSVMTFGAGRVGAQTRTLLSDWVDGWATSGPLVRFPGLSCLALALVSAAGLIVGNYRHKLLGILGVFLVVAALSQLYVCFHGDAMEVPRHAVVVGVLLRLAAVCAFGLVLSAASAVLAEGFAGAGRAGLTAWRRFRVHSSRA